MPPPLQLLARNAVAALRLIAQGEEGLLATGGGACPRNLEHLLAGHECGFAFARRARKGAIVADVPAQVSQRNEDLARVADDPAVPLVAEGGCGRDQPVQVRRAGEGVRFLDA